MLRKVSLPPCLTPDLLQLWSDEDNPYQYLFMGSKGTQTPLHQDQGGLAVLITCLSGHKAVTMVHRDDASRLNNGNADVGGRTFTLEEYPQVAFARTWHCVIGPGDVLVMPEGAHLRRPPSDDHSSFTSPLAHPPSSSSSPRHLPPCGEPDELPFLLPPHPERAVYSWRAALLPG